MSRARQVANFDPALFSADEVSGDKVSGGTIGAGTLGSGVTFPAGMVRQVKEIGLGTVASGGTDTGMPSSGAVGFDNAILSSSDVFVMTSGTVIMRDSSHDTNCSFYFSGGGFGSTTSGRIFAHDLYVYLSSIHAKVPFVGTALDTSPGSTTPTYQVYIARNASHGVEFASLGDGHCGYMTLIEILA